LKHVQLKIFQASKSTSNLTGPKPAGFPSECKFYFRETPAATGSHVSASVPVPTANFTTEPKNGRTWRKCRRRGVRHPVLEKPWNRQERGRAKFPRTASDFFSSTYVGL